MSDFANHNGAWGALGTTALLAAGALVSRGRPQGSFQLSTVQQRLMRVRKRYKHDPEAVVRAIDMVVSLLPGFPQGMGWSEGLPGVWDSTDHLIENIQILKDDPSADMSDYHQVVVDLVKSNTYGQQMDAPEIDVSVDWTFDKHIGWLAREVARAVKAKRKGWNTESEMLGALSQIHDRAGYVFDWVYAERPNLSRYSFPEALHESEEWHRASRQRANEAKIQRLKASGSIVLGAWPRIVVRWSIPSTMAGLCS